MLHHTVSINKKKMLRKKKILRDEISKDITELIKKKRKKFKVDMTTLYIKSFVKIEKEVLTDTNAVQSNSSNTFR